MTITDTRGEKFTENGYLEKNIDGLIETVIEKSDKSLNILVVGRPGSGKSSLDLFLSRYIDPEDFNIEDNVAFTHDQFMDLSKNKDKKQLVVHSEGRNSFNRTIADRTNINESQEIIYQWRFKNHLRLVEFQKVRHFDEEALKDEFHAVIRCFYPESRHAPFCHFYSKKKLAEITFDNRRKKVYWPDPDFREMWPNPEEEIPELWDRYEQINERKLQEDVENGDNSQVEELSENENLLSVGDFKERVGVSGKTVRNWCDQDKINYYRLDNGDRRIPESEISAVVNDPESPSAKRDGEKVDNKHSN